MSDETRQQTEVLVSATLDKVVATARTTCLLDESSKYPLTCTGSPVTTGNGRKQYAAPRGAAGAPGGDASFVDNLAATPAHGTSRICLALSEPAIAVARGPPSWLHTCHFSRSAGPAVLVPQGSVAGVAVTIVSDERPALETKTRVKRVGSRGEKSKTRKKKKNDRSKKQQKLSLKETHRRRLGLAVKLYPSRSQPSSSPLRRASRVWPRERKRAIGGAQRTGLARTSRVSARSGRRVTNDSQESVDNSSYGLGHK